ncbi:MAG: hypothetical protein EBQ96_02865 [Proteobacteria bacterium]|nr:hypothetical protein [Pseudomonadota bacterium]
MQSLSTYDPDWEAKYIEQHERLPAIWRRAVSEVRQQGKLSRETRAEYIGVLDMMRRTRQKQFRTPADVAKRVFNIVSARAALAGEKIPSFPKPDDFRSLREVREFLYEKTMQIKQAQAARKAKFSTQALPVAPKGEGVAFNGTNDFDIFSMAFLVPDVGVEQRSVLVNGKLVQETSGNGEVFILTSERADNARYICISTRRHPEKFEALLPQVASAVYERLFKAEDAADMQFFVHYPSGYARDGAEQYWSFDMRPDARGQFTIHGRKPLPMVPYGIANRRMNDGQRENDTAVTELPRGYDPYIVSWAAGFEAQQFAITQGRRNGLYLN